MRTQSRRHPGFGVLSLLTLVLLAPCSVPAETEDLSLNAAEILRKTDEAEGYESCYAEMRQIITTSADKERTLVIRSWAVDDGDKQLAEYLSPPDIRGQRILMTDDGDNIWMFNPETRRTRRLGSHMKKRKVMGSDFSYEDQAGGRFSEKYKGVLLRVEEQGDVDCYVLELTPTPAGPSYRKIVAWVAKTDFVTRRVDFYRDDEEEPFKRLITEDIREVGDKVVPHRITMMNLEDQTRTVNVVTEIQYGVKIPDFVFEARNLER